MRKAITLIGCKKGYSLIEAMVFLTLVSIALPALLGLGKMLIKPQLPIEGPMCPGIILQSVYNSSSTSFPANAPSDTPYLTTSFTPRSETSIIRVHAVMGLQTTNLGRTQTILQAKLWRNSTPLQSRWHSASTSSSNVVLDSSQTFVFQEPSPSTSVEYKLTIACTQGCNGAVVDSASIIIEEIELQDYNRDAAQ